MAEPAAPQIPEPTCSADRRALCLGALAAGLSLACGGGSGGSATFAPAPSTSGTLTTSDTRAALLAAPDGTTRDYRNLGSFLLIKDGGGIYAMTAVCTHLGCTVGLPSGGRIVCPCHGSEYDLGGGNLVGPAPSPLVHFQVAEASPGGFLTVNTGRTVSASTRLT